MYSSTILWFRNDLRLWDNVTLTEAIKKSRKVYPVYCLDPRQFAPTPLGYPKTGPFRAKFLLETLQDLRHHLQKIGSDLIIRQGLPEEIIPRLAKEWQVEAVFASKEITAEEVRVENQLETLLMAEKITFSLWWQSTLLHIEDIPWPVKNIPDIFTQFRKEAEKTTPVRPSLAPPTQMNSIEPIAAGSLPHLSALGLTPIAPNPKAIIPFAGGERMGRARLQEFLWDTDSLKNYKETRNDLRKPNGSSKLSAWLANGSLSPRTVYEEVKKYEKERHKNSSTYWLIFELLWRDYFKLMARKHGSKIFKLEGIQDKPLDLEDNMKSFLAWANGSTGIPFIDANMREMNATGYMSNRGRQNVASFLIKDLKVNWTWGASYFESMLIDYDVCSNWGNWNYIAGVGNDPRENRYFNIMSQARKYDPQGDYVRHWIPELAYLPGKKIHYPPELPTKELHQSGIRLGKSYPRPIVSFNRWLY